jgi:transposase-like protein
MSESATESPISKANGIGPPLSGQKRNFTDEFKRGIVARVKKGEVASKVASEYQLSGSVLRRWMANEVKAKKGKPLRGGGQRKPLNGVSVGPTGKKAYTEEFQRRAVKRLGAGESAIKLAKELKIHNSMLYSWAKKFGVRLTLKKSEPRAGADPRFTDQFKANIVKRYRNGEAASKISKQEGIKEGRIYYWAAQEPRESEEGAAPRATGPAIGFKAAISYLKHSLNAKSERVRVALVTLALASLEGEL